MFSVKDVSTVKCIHHQNWNKLNDNIICRLVVRNCKVQLQVQTWTSWEPEHFQLVAQNCLKHDSPQDLLFNLIKLPSKQILLLIQKTVFGSSWKYSMEASWHCQVVKFRGIYLSTNAWSTHLTHNPVGRRSLPALASPNRGRCTIPQAKLCNNLLPVLGCLNICCISLNIWRCLYTVLI